MGKQKREPLTWAKIHQRLAEVYFALRDLKRAEREAKRSLKLNGKIDDRYGRAINLRLLGIIREKLHDTGEAVVLLTKSLSLFQELELEGESATVYAGLGAVWLNAAHWPNAREAYENEQRIRSSSGDSYGLAFVYANLGKLAIAESGNIDEALRYLTASEGLLREFRDPGTLAKVLSNESLILTENGRYTEALDKIAEACRLAPEGNSIRLEFEKRKKVLQRLVRGDTHSNE